MGWNREEWTAVRAGSRDLFAYSLGLLAWGLVTGVAIAKSFLTPAEAVGMTLLVYGGSAQLAALPLMALGFPVWMVMGVAAIVNLRFVIFSAGIQPHFKSLSLPLRMLLGFLNGDLTFAIFKRRYPTVTADPLELPYYVGVSVSNWLGWQAGSLLGIFLAAFIPDGWGLGFAGSLVLLAVLIPMVRSAAGVLAAVVAGVVAVSAAGLPYRLNLVLAVICAVLVGLVADRLVSRSACSEGAV